MLRGKCIASVTKKENSSINNLCSYCRKLKAENKIKLRQQKKKLIKIRAKKESVRHRHFFFFQIKSCQRFKERIILILHNLLQKIEREKNIIFPSFIKK